MDHSPEDVEYLESLRRNDKRLAILENGHHNNLWTYEALDGDAYLIVRNGRAIYLDGETVDRLPFDYFVGNEPTALRESPPLAPEGAKARDA